ncbi:hypothetical protein [Novosphingobium aerophilum]|nr:hypothetical protein [Novosphingobium aerophilum]
MTSTTTSPLNGNWEIALATPIGPQAMVLSVAVEGGAVSGSVVSPEGTQAIEAAQAEGNRLRFDLRVAKPMKITLSFDLETNGGSIAGKCKMGMFGSAKVDGQRA